MWDMLRDQVETSAAAVEAEGLEAHELAAPLVVGGTLRMLDVVLMPCRRMSKGHAVSAAPQLATALRPAPGGWLAWAQTGVTRPGGAPEPL